MPQEPRPATYRDVLLAEAKKLRIPPELALALVETESSGRLNPPDAGAGAVGLMQLLPDTAAGLGVDPADPIQNIRGGLTYLRQQLDASMTEGRADVAQALARYHGGPDPANHGPKTQAYVQTILGRLRPGGGGTTTAPAPTATQPASPPQPPSTLPGSLRQVGQPPPSTPATAAFSRDRLSPGETWGEWGVRQGRQILESYDPRQPEGRQNLLGAAGAVATLHPAVRGVRTLTSTAALLRGAAGAGLGGAAAETGEQLVGTKPTDALAVGGAASTQIIYEAVGGAAVWPFKAAIRRIKASPVSRAAREGLARTRQATIQRLQTVLDAASAATGDVRELASQTVRQVRRSAADRLRTTRRDAREGVRAAQAHGDAGLQASAGEFASLVGQPPSATQAGRAVEGIIQRPRRGRPAGPAETARARAGQRIDEAAQIGPPVDVSALKAEAQAIVDRIAQPETTFPRRIIEEDVGEGVASGAQAVVTRSGRDSFPLGSGAKARLEQQAAAGDATAAATLRAMGGGAADLAAAQAEVARETYKHKAMGVLNRILNADDIVPFHDAHLWKSELQEALRDTYDKAQRKQVEAITAKIAGGLREALDWAPYNQATEAYEAIIPAYTKEYVAAFRKVAQTDPTAIVRDIRPNNPEAARLLRDVLVTQSAEGGQPEAGQRAWDLVRSAWTHQHVLSKGLDGLDAQLQRLTSRPIEREFTEIFYGDASGRQVLEHMQTIARTYQAAKAAVPELTAAARQAGEAALEGARAGGDAAVEAARTAAAGVRRQAATDIRTARLALREARLPTEAETRYLQSSLARGTLTPEQVGADIVRGALIRGLWGFLSLMRLARGPRERDLLEWMAYSPARTQTWVRLATGANPTAVGIADLLRGVFQVGGREDQVGRPPDRAQGAGPATGAGGGPVGSQVGAPPPQ
jgi:hypothetical protein